MADLFYWMPDLKGNPALLAFIALVSFGLSFIGAAVGLVLGHFRLPLLIAYFGNPVLGAAMNLVVSGIGAFAGAIGHLLGGRVSLDCLVLMGIPSLAGAALAAWLITTHVNHFWSHLVIGLMLVYSGYTLLQPTDKSKSESDTGKPRLLMEVVIGLFLGGLAALTGLMLGSLRLPLMLKYLRIDPKVAVGSNMAIGCLTAIAAAISYFASAGTTLKVEWGPVWLVLAAVIPPTVVGGWLGVRLTGKIEKDDVRRMAGWAVVAAGLFMAVQAALPLMHPKHRHDYADFFDDEEEPWDGDDD